MNHVLAATLLRVVLDTNIYIAAFGHPKGRNATLWAAALARRYRLLVSPAIVRELARVLRTVAGPDFRRTLGLY